MIVKLIVDGGSMKPGPAVSQQLGPMGINLGKVIEDVNKATSGFRGMKVPVEINVNSSTKQFTIKVSSPPVAELIKKEISVEKGSGKAKEMKVGNLGIEQVIAIAKTKMPNMLAKDLKSAVQLVVGSCVSLGVLIESKEAKQVAQEIEQGIYDKEIKEEKTEASEEKANQLREFFSKIKAKQEADAKAAEAEKLKAAEEAAKTEETKAAVPAEKKAEEPKKETKKKEEKPKKK